MLTVLIFFGVLFSFHCWGWRTSSNLAFEDSSEIRCLGVILCANEKRILMFKLQIIRECYSFLSKDISTLPKGWEYTSLTLLIQL